MIIYFPVIIKKTKTRNTVRVFDSLYGFWHEHTIVDDLSTNALLEFLYAKHSYKNFSVQFTIN